MRCIPASLIRANQGNNFAKMKRQSQQSMAITCCNQSLDNYPFNFRGRQAQIKVGVRTQTSVSIWPGPCHHNWSDLCRKSTKSDKRRPCFMAGYLKTGTIMKAPLTPSPLSELHVWNIWGDFIRCVMFLEEAVCLGDSLNGALSRGRWVN